MASQQHHTQPHLVRSIGLWSGVAIVVGSAIGSGIFKSPSSIAEQLPGPLPMLMAWISGGLLVLCGALTVAEISSAFPYSGGQFVFIREGYGRLPAFMFGWVQLVLIGPAGLGGLSIVFGQYALQLGLFGPESVQSEIGAAALGILAIVVVTLANVFGLKLGTAIQNWTTVAKTGGLVVLILLALALGLGRTGGHFSPAIPAGSMNPTMFGLALASTLWAYDGWINSTFVSGEFSNPQKNIPRSILLGTVIVMVVYVLANVAYLSVFHATEISKSPAIASDVMGRLVGPFGVTFIVSTVLISVFGTLNSGALTMPRVFFAMAEDRLFFPLIASVHPKFKTPHVSIFVTSGLAIVYVVIATVMSGSKAFNSLSNAFVIGNVPFYAMTVGSIFIFRRRERKRHKLSDPKEDSLIDPVSPGHLETHPHRYSPSVHVPLFPVIPIIFIATNIYLLLNSLIDKDARIPTVITLIIVLVGAPVYYLTVGRNPKRQSN